MLKKLKLTREIWAWALYDWANSAFATTVLVAFFPIFFKQFWTIGSDPHDSTFKWGLANSIASTVLAFLNPVLGAFSDQGHTKVHLLTFFALMGIFATAALYWVGKGQWEWALVCFVVGSIGFFGANTFYDSLLVNVAQRDQTHFVSALGFSLGYLGGGLLLIINVLWTLHPQAFGFADAGVAIRASFLSVAIWWFLFSVPLWIFVREKGRPPAHPLNWRLLYAGLMQVKSTFLQLKKIPGVWMFLLAYFFYIDGVHTVIKMSTDYGLALGFQPQDLIAALVLVQLIGFPAALAFGQMARRWGPRPALNLGLFIYILTTIWGYFITAPWEFYVLAALIGLVQGGVQSISRSVFANLIPTEKSGEFFGFYNMLGKFSAILGPLLVGTVSLQTGNARLSLLSVLILFGAGIWFLRRVPIGRGPDF